MPHLGNDISSELGILGCFMGQVGGDKIDESLNLMHHRIHVGHLQSVFDSRDTAWPNNPVNFFMKFLCQDINEVDLKI